MKIVLIGYRGTGKSVVGELVAKRLKLSYVGMDVEIVKKAGMSIPEIVATYGWPGFRDMESEVAQALAARDQLVIDTGGGVIERPENITALQKNAQLIWLKASVATIVSRIQGDTERPSLTGEKSFTEEVSEILTKRLPKYQRAAQYEIDTDQLTPQQVADKICRFCGEP
ncbi:MAG: shikimate kinase [Desulfobacterales bacterium]|jgi:shikimate kinase|nr:shikimate kinase [Desulfobacterales bacterium]